MYMYMYIYIYIHINTYKYVFSITFLCSLTYTCIHTLVHMFTHKHEHVEGGKNRVFTDKERNCFPHHQVLLEKLLTVPTSWSLLVCVEFFLVCDCVKRAWSRVRWTKASVRVNRSDVGVVKCGVVGSMTNVFCGLYPLRRSIPTVDWFFLNES